MKNLPLSRCRKQLKDELLRWEVSGDRTGRSNLQTNNFHGCLEFQPYDTG